MIVACLSCELLFEVDENTSYRCPQCERALVPHEPPTPPEPSDIFEEASVDHTQLLDVPLDPANSAQLTDSVDDWARFGSSVSVSIDATRVLSPPKQIRGGTLDRTQVLDAVDDFQHPSLGSTVHSRGVTSASSNEVNYQNEKDLWTSAQRLDENPDSERSIHISGRSDAGQRRTRRRLVGLEFLELDSRRAHRQSHAEPGQMRTRRLLRSNHHESPAQKLGHQSSCMRQLTKRPPFEAERFGPSKVSIKLRRPPQNARSSWS